jgi:hypothetical protein
MARKPHPKSTGGRNWKAAAAAALGFRDLQLQLQLQFHENICRKKEIN